MNIQAGTLVSLMDGDIHYGDLVIGLDVTARPNVCSIVGRTFWMRKIFTELEYWCKLAHMTELSYLRAKDNTRYLGLYKEFGYEELPHNETHVMMTKKL